MNQIWLVEAYTVGLSDSDPCYQWAFTTKEEAKRVQQSGKQSLSNLRWTLTPVQFGDESQAGHDMAALQNSMEV